MLYILTNLVFIHLCLVVKNRWLNVSKYGSQKKFYHLLEEPVHMLWMINLKEKMDAMNKLIRKLRDENKILKYNQKKHKYDKGGIFYVLQVIDTPNKKLKKIGSSNNMNNRLKTYNTTVPNNVKVLLSINIDNPAKLEKCMKLALESYIYRDGKEYYDCSMTKIEEAVNECIAFIDKFNCGECSGSATKLSHMVKHLKEEHGFANDNVLVTPFAEYPFVIMNGGANELSGSDIPKNIYISQ